MNRQCLVFRSPMPASAETVSDWHCRPGAFERLMPPWEAVRVLEQGGGVADGSSWRYVPAAGFGPSRWRWCERCT